MNKLNCLYSLCALALIITAFDDLRSYAADSTTSTPPKQIVCKLEKDLLGGNKAQKRIDAIDKLLSQNNCKNADKLKEMSLSDQVRLKNISNFGTKLSSANDCEALASLATMIKDEVQTGLTKRPYDGQGPSLYKGLLSKAKDLKCDKLPKTKEIWGKIKTTEDTLSSKETVDLPDTSTNK